MRPYIAKDCQVEADGLVVMVGQWEGLISILLPAGALVRLLSSEPILLVAAAVALVVLFVTRPRRRLRFDANERKLAADDSGWFRESPPALSFDEVKYVAFESAGLHGAHDKCAIMRTRRRASRSCS